MLGGVTTFLFASVAVSGLRVLSYNRFTRRDRFVLAAALSFGVGDLLVPNIFTHLFDGVRNPNKGLTGLFDSITIVLSTPCEILVQKARICVLMITFFLLVLSSGIVAVILNLLLPQETQAEEEEDGVDVVDVVDVESQNQKEGGSADKN